MKIGKTHKFYADVFSRHSGVTGSCFLNSIHWPDGTNLRFLVDAGAAQGNDNDGFFNCFFPFNTGKIDFIILTHGHQDHQGLLPVVIRQGFRGNIYTSYATSKLINLSLYDCCKISDPYLGSPLATQNEVERTLDLIIGYSNKKTIKPHKNVSIVFYSNGHLLGAIVTLIIISCPGEDDITLVYTGDYKNNNISKLLLVFDYDNYEEEKAKGILQEMSDICIPKFEQNEEVATTLIDLKGKENQLVANDMVFDNIEFFSRIDREKNKIVFYIYYLDNE